MEQRGKTVRGFTGSVRRGGNGSSGGGWADTRFPHKVKVKLAIINWGSGVLLQKGGGPKSQNGRK